LRVGFFFYLDDDQDGKVTVEEFQQLTIDRKANYVENIDGSSMTSVKFATLFLAADTDDDDNVLTEEEFVSANLSGAALLLDATFAVQVGKWLELAKLELAKLELAKLELAKLELTKAKRYMIAGLGNPGTLVLYVHQY
jgi:hypothetical protein